MTPETNKPIITVVSDADGLMNGVNVLGRNMQKVGEMKGYNIDIVGPYSQNKNGEALFNRAATSGKKHLEFVFDWPPKVYASLQKKLSESNAVLILTNELPLGFLASRVCLDNNIPYTSAVTTDFSEYTAMRIRELTGSFVSLKSNWLEPTIMNIYRNASNVLVPTPIIKKQLEKYKISSAVWQRGVNLDIFYPKKEDEENPFDNDLRCRGKYLIYGAGRIAVEKQWNEFLDIPLEKLEKAVGKPCQKIMFGDGELLDSFKEKYMDTIFFGRLPQNELVKYARHCNLHVLTSTTDTWAQENSEAAAMGIPTAAWRGFSKTGKPISSACSIIENVTGCTKRFGKTSFIKIIKEVASKKWNKCSEAAAKEFSLKKAFKILIDNLSFRS